MVVDVLRFDSRFGRKVPRTTVVRSDSVACEVAPHLALMFNIGRVDADCGGHGRRIKFYPAKAERHPNLLDVRCMGIADRHDCVFLNAVCSLASPPLSSYLVRVPKPLDRASVTSVAVVTRTVSPGVSPTHRA